jgi:hypothetical protein
MTFMNILTFYHLEIIMLFYDEASFGELNPREIKSNVFNIFVVVYLILNCILTLHF